jgi:hypothetical protein
MSVHRAVRLVAGLVSVIAAMSLIASSALAAGKPVIQSTTTQAPVSVNEMTYGAQINPNGAATTYKFEYGKTEGLGSSTPSGNAGEGSSVVTVAPMSVRGLDSGTLYYYRVAATNKYGTTTSSIKWGYTLEWLDWDLQKNVYFPETYASSGTFKIGFPTFGSTIACNESGYGVIDEGGGTADEVNLQLTGCVFEGTSCKVSISPKIIHLGHSLVSNESTLMNIEADELCSMFNTSLPNKGAFKIQIGSPSAALSVALSGSSSFGVHPVTLSGTSTWVLTGKGAGAKFGWG